MKNENYVWYFYKITNNINNHFYYGVHKTTDVQDTYMGSGYMIKYAIKKYGIQNFSKSILKIFDNEDDAYQYEEKIVNEKCINNPKCYNMVLGGKHKKPFLNTHNILVKDKNNKLFYLPKDHPKVVSGEYVYINAGKVAVRDKNNHTFMVDKNDKRLKTGELVGVNKGRKIVYDQNHNIIACDINDERLKTGEFIGINKGYTLAKDKDGKIYRIKTNDPKLLSGELVGVNKGKVLCKDKDGNKIWTSTDDPRYISGEIVHWNKGQKLTDEQRKKYLESIKNKNQKGENSPCYGKKYVFRYNENNKIERKIIESRELNLYLNNGWRRGQGPKHTSKKMTISKKDKNLIWLYYPQTGERKQIPFDDIEKYMLNGWRKGF